MRKDNSRHQDLYEKAVDEYEGKIRAMKNDMENLQRLNKELTDKLIQQQTRNLNAQGTSGTNKAIAPNNNQTAIVKVNSRLKKPTPVSRNSNIIIDI